MIMDIASVVREFVKWLMEEKRMGYGEAVKTASEVSGFSEEFVREVTRDLAVEHGSSVHGSEELGSARGG